MRRSAEGRRTRRRFLSVPGRFSAGLDAPPEFIDLAAHLNNLLAHMQRHLDAFKVHT